MKTADFRILSEIFSDDGLMSELKTQIAERQRKIDEQSRQLEK